jgi:hypothetical protein
VSKLYLSVVAVLVAALSFVGTTMLRTSAAATTFHPANPSGWIDPSSGRLERSRVPERIAVSTDLLPGGWGWVQSTAVFPESGAAAVDGPFDVFASASSSAVVGQWHRSLGVSTGQQDVRRKPIVEGVDDNSGPLIAPTVEGSP